MELFRDLGYEEGNENPNDWLDEDCEDPGFQILSDSEIVAEVTGEAGDLSSDTEGVH